MSLTLSLNRRHGKVSANRGMSSVFEVSELLGSLFEPLGSLANILEIIELLSKQGGKLVPTTNALYLAYTHCVLVTGGVDHQAAEAELVLLMILQA